jgi:hypothetical protein
VNHIAKALFNVSVATAEDLLEAKTDMVEIEYPGAQEWIHSGESPAN